MLRPFGWPFLFSARVFLPPVLVGAHAKAAFEALAKEPEVIKAAFHSHIDYFGEWIFQQKNGF